jgi:hypothetical protein
MIAFAACLHEEELDNATWLAALEEGTYWLRLLASHPAGVLPNSNILRSPNSKPRTGHRVRPPLPRETPGGPSSPPISEIRCQGSKTPGQALYDRADALVAALGALPHVADDFHEVPNWAADQNRWTAAAGDEQVEESFTSVA